MTKYYSIMLGYTADVAPTTAAVDSLLNGAVKDWLRLNAYQYLVATELSAEQLFAQLKPVLPFGANIIVMSVNLHDRYGWASALIGDWIRKHAP